MDQQPVLFDLPRQNTIDALLARLPQGRIFHSVRDVQRLTCLTMSQIYWAVWYCRLDAICVCGQWRIPYTAVLEWWPVKEDLERLDAEYLETVKEREVPLALKARSYMDAGINRLEIKKTLYAAGVVANDYLLDSIAARILPDRTQPAEEQECLDWYGLDSLPLPAEASVGGWASVLAVSRDALAADGLWPPEQMVDRDQMLDYLVLRERVNSPVFTGNPDIGIPEELVEENCQLELFGGLE